MNTRIKRGDVNLLIGIVLLSLSFVLLFVTCFDLWRVDKLEKQVTQESRQLEQFQQVNQSLNVLEAQVKNHSVSSASSSLVKQEVQQRTDTLQLANRGDDRPQRCQAPPAFDKTLRLGPSVGVWTVSFYTATATECGNNRGITASGKYVSPGYTAAADLRYWPIGTKLYVDGWGFVEVLDSGKFIKGPHRADLCICSKAVAYQLGKQQRRVWLVE